MPLLYLDKKLWLYDGAKETVYSGSINSTFKDSIDDYLKRYNITHWMLYVPEAPSESNSL